MSLGSPTPGVVTWRAAESNGCNRLRTSRKRAACMPEPTAVSIRSPHVANGRQVAASRSRIASPSPALDSRLSTLDCEQSELLRPVLLEQIDHSGMPVLLGERASGAPVDVVVVDVGAVRDQPLDRADL